MYRPGSLLSAAPGLGLSVQTQDPASGGRVPPSSAVRSFSIAAMMLVVTAIGPLALPTPAFAAAGSPDIADLAPGELSAEMLALLNAERGAAGLPALEEFPALDEVAVTRAVDMASLGYFGHRSPTGADAEHLLHAFGVPFTQMGENIARTTLWQGHAIRLVHDALMASDAHRANILEPGFQRVGIGIALAEMTYYFAVVFVDAH